MCMLVVWLHGFRQNFGSENEIKTYFMILFAIFLYVIAAGTILFVFEII
jgi:hypothetical protein